jgi:hypothetical protein
MQKTANVRRHKILDSGDFDRAAGRVGGGWLSMELRAELCSNCIVVIERQCPSSAMRLLADTLGILASTMYRARLFNEFNHLAISTSCFVPAWVHLFNVL